MVKKFKKTPNGYEKYIKYSPDGDASKYGLTDLYPIVEAELTTILASGVAFETEELSSKKDICSWKMKRETKNGKIIISVWQGIDEGFDLVNDAYYEINESDCELTDDDYCIILDKYVNGNDFEATASFTVSSKSKLDNILKIVDALYEETSDELEKYYNNMKEIVSKYISNKEEEI